MTDQTNDGRPPIWTGHLGPLNVTDLAASKEFYQTLGLRLVHDLEDTAILEMRGGTHLVLLAAGDDGAEPGKVPFDFMVDDIAGTHARLVEAGIDLDPIEDGRIHRTFTITDPTGHQIPVYDSHVVGTV